MQAAEGEAFAEVGGLILDRGNSFDLKRQQVQVSCKRP